MKRTVISLIIALSLLFALGISVYAGEGDTAPALESAETAEEKAVGAAEDATMSAQLSRLLSENTTGFQDILKSLFSAELPPAPA